MKISFTGKPKGDLKTLQADIEKRITNVGRHLGRHVADNTTREVQRRLKGSGWIRIYRQAIIYRETPDGGEWAVAGLAELTNRPELFRNLASTSLAAFSPTGDGRWPSEYNPWPLDMIPAAFYRGSTILVRNAPEATVEGERGKRARNLPTLLRVLSERGIAVRDDGLPVAENGIFADIAYLARRLELGYPGFPRIPHWGPAASTAEAAGNRWLKEPNLLRLVEGAIKGAEPGEVPQMSRAEASDLARLREATWP